MVRVLFGFSNLVLFRKLVSVLGVLVNWKVLVCIDSDRFCGLVVLLFLMKLEIEDVLIFVFRWML